MFRKLLRLLLEKRGEEALDLAKEIQGILTKELHNGKTKSSDHNADLGG